MVARHLVAAGTLVEDDPAQALLHARFARRRASRIAVVREAAGIAAYHAGEWNEALGELRAARRMGGGPGHLAVMADIERALGRPERALELARGPEVRELGRADAIELAIVAAGARRDLGELDAAVVGLQIPELDPSRRDPWSARLFYAYADNLLAAGRESDALQWFVHTVDADTDGETDADRRLADLSGDPLADDDIEFDVEDREPTGDASNVVIESVDQVMNDPDDDALSSDASGVRPDGAAEVGPEMVGPETADTDVVVVDSEQVDGEHATDSAVSEVPGAADDQIGVAAVGPVVVAPDDDGTAR